MVQPEAIPAPIGLAPEPPESSNLVRLLPSSAGQDPITLHVDETTKKELIVILTPHIWRPETPEALNHLGTPAQLGAGPAGRSEAAGRGKRRSEHNDNPPADGGLSRGYPLLSPLVVMEWAFGSGEDFFLKAGANLPPAAKKPI